MGLKLPVIIRAEIPESPEEINNFIKQLIELVKQYVSLKTSVERNYKLILVELITNTIKHVKKGEGSNLELYFDDPRIEIIKTDKSYTLVFDNMTMPFNSFNKHLTVFLSGNKHDILVLDYYKFQFLERQQQELNSLETLPEHYGLKIITAASEKFIYEYKPSTKENIFSVSMLNQ